MQVCECLETIKTTASTSTTTASTSTTTASTSTTTASSSTTTASTSKTLYGCDSPQWAKDQWCDDENNNAGCEFDGGACCNNNFVGWDSFCQVSISYQILNFWCKICSQTLNFTNIFALVHNFFRKYLVCLLFDQ